MVFNTWAYYLFSSSQRNFIPFEPAAIPTAVDLLPAVAAFSSIFPILSWVELFLRRAWEFFFGNPLPAGFTGRNRGSVGWRVAQAIVLLFIIKYWNFSARLV